MPLRAMALWRDGDCRARTLEPMLALRTGFAVAVVGIVVGLLRAGIPLAAVTVVVLAVWLRRIIEAHHSPAPH